MDGEHGITEAVANGEEAEWPAGDAAEWPAEEAAPTYEQLWEYWQEATREKEETEMQYQNLMEKVQQMRESISDKMRGDTEELARRGEAIEQLQRANADLTEGLQAAKSEILLCHQDLARAEESRDAMERRYFELSRASSEEVLDRQAEYRRLHEEVEQLKIEQTELRQLVEREKLRADDADAALVQASVEADEARAAMHTAFREREAEAEAARNLQSVLDDVTLSKQDGLDRQYAQVVEQLDEKSRALESAENALREARDEVSRIAAAAQRTEDLERDLAAKNETIARLRHEAVLSNERLSAALSRLRKTMVSDDLVDRTLVSNVLMSFFELKRGDAKRYQVLQLLSGVLSWGDEEKLKVGLINQATARARPHEDTESFSNQFTEFLLKEVNKK